MRRFVLVGAMAALTAFLPGLSGRLHAADASLSGVWKISLLMPGRETPMFLVEIKDKDGTPAAEMLSSGNPALKDAKVENMTMDAGKSCHFVIAGGGASYTFAAYSAKPGEKVDEMLGSYTVNGRRSLIRLDRSDLKELPPPAPVTVPAPPLPAAVQAFRKAIGLTDVKEKIAALNDVLADKSADPATALNAGVLLLPVLTEAKAEADKARSAADATIDLAGRFGPEERRDVLQRAARTLSQSETTRSLAVDYARAAEKLLDPSADPKDQRDMLKVLHTALTRNGDTAAAKPIGDRLAKIDDELDAAFLRDAIPFKPMPFAGRTGKGDRVAVVELFTGAQCPPCVAIDVAFDALGKTYKADDLVLLQYHLHIPGPDRLTNADTEKRAQFYGVNATPTLFLDGLQNLRGGGPKPFSEAKYNDLTKAINPEVDVVPGAKVTLKAERRGGKISVHAEASDASKDGDMVRLRLVLVEEEVRYPGNNGQRIHSDVVRALPGGIDGVALKDKAAKQDAEIVLDVVRKNQADYWETANKKFIDDEEPIDLKRLKVVAFVQDDRTKEILQAAQVDVPDAK